MYCDVAEYLFLTSLPLLKLFFVYCPCRLLRYPRIFLLLWDADNASLFPKKQRVMSWASFLHLLNWNFECYGCSDLWINEQVPCKHWRVVLKSCRPSYPCPRCHHFAFLLRSEMPPHWICQWPKLKQHFASQFLGEAWSYHSHKQKMMNHLQRFKAVVYVYPEGNRIGAQQRALFLCGAVAAFNLQGNHIPKQWGPNL